MASYAPRRADTRLRTMHDAILIGVQTVIMDDPRLKSTSACLFPAVER